MWFDAMHAPTAGRWRSPTGTDATAMHSDDPPMPFDPSTARPLAGFRILVAEDEPALAAAVADVLGDAGAEVIGPYTTPGESLAVVRSESLDAAYVDLELRLGLSEPVVRALRERGLPALVVSGIAPERRPAWTRGLPFLAKPVTARMVTEAFVDLLVRARGASAA